MIKKIIFPILSLFLAFRTYELIISIYYAENASFSIPISILFSVLINLFITGIFAFMGFAYKTSNLLGPAYYKIYKPEFLTVTYNFFQVKYFKHFLLAVFWGKEKNKKKFFDGSKAGLKNFEYQTKQAEFGHLCAFIFITIATLIILFKGHYLIAIGTTMINVFFNFYPIILQRKHRFNINRLKNIMQKRKVSRA